MLLLLLAACYDRMVVTATVDVPADRVSGTSHLVNLWRQYVTCEDTPTCAAALEQEVQNTVGALKEKGATEAKAWLELHEGQLDLKAAWTLPLAGATYDNQVFVLLREGPARGVLDPARRKPRAALVFTEDRNTRVVVDRAPLGTRVWQLPDSPDRSGLLFPGKRFDVQVSFVTLDDEQKVAHGDPWIANFVGMEEALRRTPGLLVDR